MATDFNQLLDDPQAEHRAYIARRLGWGSSRISLAEPLPEIDPALAAIMAGRFTPGSASGAPLAR